MNSIEDVPRGTSPAHESEARPGFPRSHEGGPPPLPGTAPHPADWGPRLGRGLDSRRKSPALACILSLMPGLGQIYVGYYKLGFVHIGVFAATIMFLAAGDGASELHPPMAIFLAFFFLYNVVDAGRRAAFYNQALAGIGGFALPAEPSLPGPGGSIAGGVVLIVGGGLLLSSTVFGLPLDWLEQWWPLAPILGGAWLLLRGLQERAKS